MNGGSTRVDDPSRGRRPRRSPPWSRTWPGRCRSARCSSGSSSAPRSCWLRRRIDLLVDEPAGVYRKEADIGIACQSGMVFPLTEGTTGAVVARRGPVIFEDYGDVPGGHVRPEDREELKGVIGVPIWWRGAIVGSCVVFTRDPDRVFVHEDAELLELFAKHAAIAITNARLHEAAESEARAEPPRRNATGWPARCTTPSRRGSCRCCCRSGRRYRSRTATSRSDGRARRGPCGGRSGLRRDERSVLGLAPSPLEGRSLEEALELEIAWANRTGVLDAHLVTAGQSGGARARRGPHAVPDRAGALTNAIRHARATLGPGRAGVLPTGVSSWCRTTARASTGPRSPRTARCTASGSAGWPSAPGCSAGPWSSTRHRDGAPDPRLDSGGVRVAGRRGPTGPATARPRGGRSRRDEGRHRPSPRLGRPGPQIVGRPAGAGGGRRVAHAAPGRRAHGPQDARRRRRRGDRHGSARRTRSATVVAVSAFASDESGRGEPCAPARAATSARTPRRRGAPQAAVLGGVAGRDRALGRGRRAPRGPPERQR